MNWLKQCWCRWFRPHRHSQYHDLIQALNRLAMKADEVVQQLNDTKTELAGVNERLVKIGTETDKLLQTIADLTAQVANADIPQSVVDAVAAVKSQADVVDQTAKADDDKVPDPPTT